MVILRYFSPLMSRACLASVFVSLQNEHKVTNSDANTGYSLGGRVAMAMKKCDASDHARLCQDIELAVSDSTKLLLLGFNPGGFHFEDAMVSAAHG